MRVTASAAAAAFIHDRGGRVHVWTSRHGCCYGSLTLLEVSIAEPSGAHHFQRMAADGFEAYVDVGTRGLPDELAIELHGRGRPRLRALWDGCAYATSFA